MVRKVVYESRFLPYVLLLPQLAVTLVFFFLPAGQALYNSLLSQDIFGANIQFVGLENFRSVFADPAYLASMRTTAIFSLSVALLALIPALILALMADRVRFGKGFYQTILILPYALAPVIAGVLWMFLFNPSIGVIGHALRRAGIDWNPTLNGNQALLLVVIGAAWKQISYNFLFFFAGLQAIPKSLLEVAQIDGAGPWRQFRSIIFPLLSPTSFFLLVVNMVYAFFDTFGIIDAVTHGGPAKATEVLVYKVYHDGLKALDFGISSAQSVILMMIVIALTAIQFRYVEKKVHY